MKKNKNNNDGPRDHNQGNNRHNSTDQAQIRQNLDAYVDLILSSVNAATIQNLTKLDSSSLAEAFSNYLSSETKPATFLQFLVNCFLLNDKQDDPVIKDFHKAWYTDAQLIDRITKRLLQRPAILTKLLPYISGKKDISTIFTSGGRTAIDKEEKTNPLQFLF